MVAMSGPGRAEDRAPRREGLDQALDETRRDETILVPVDEQNRTAHALERRDRVGVFQAARDTLEPEVALDARARPGDRPARPRREAGPRNTGRRRQVVPRRSV